MKKETILIGALALLIGVEAPVQAGTQKRKTKSRKTTEAAVKTSTKTSNVRSTTSKPVVTPTPKAAWRSSGHQTGTNL